MGAETGFRTAETSPDGSTGHPEGVRSVARALTLLETLAAAEELGIVELSARTGLGLATCHRLLKTLIRTGYASQSPESGRYLLGYKVFQLASRPRELTDHLLLVHGRPILRNLMHTSGETANLAVPEDLYARFVAQVPSRAAVRMVTVIGNRVPMYGTALGKVILAHSDPDFFKQVVSAGMPALTSQTIVDAERLALILGQIRHEGVAVDQEEFEDGLTCVAAPVFDHRGSIVAAISISGPSGRMSRALPQLRELVAAKGENLSGKLGHRKPRASGDCRWET